MNLISFDITFFLLPLYVLLTIILNIRYWTAKNTNFNLRSKIENWIKVINVVFVCWFFCATIYDIVILKTEFGELGVEDLMVSSYWAMTISAVLFLAAIIPKKLRASPYTMIGISIVIIINFLIAFSNVAIPV